jgi:hypothetical protein
LSEDRFDPEEEAAICLNALNITVLSQRSIPADHKFYNITFKFIVYGLHVGDQFLIAIFAGLYDAQLHKDIVTLLIT